MSLELLEQIKTPKDLKSLSYKELDELAGEVRAEIVAVTSLRGGHLASSLGSVELIIAMHRVLNCPKDRIVFDVGHQAYAHKLLTGRYKDFDSLRTHGGISAFPRIDESPYDSNNAGHASDSISTALGYSYVRDLNNEDSTIVAFIGDASISGGMAFEALNQLATSKERLIIVLNDNGMSISHNVGGLATYLAHARMSETYTTVRNRVVSIMQSSGDLGHFLQRKSTSFNKSVKQLMLPDGMLFEDFGLTYLGPIDGHNMEEIEGVLKNAKKALGPVIIHAVTAKGKGYYHSEVFPENYHGIGKFDIRTGKKTGASSGKCWTSVFSDEVIKLAHQHEDIIAVTAAMAEGTGLDTFKGFFPDRFIDVGISEEHAVAMAGAIAEAGKVPFVAIYSTFLQRTFDQMIINVALQKQHVVFCVDRAGIVGEDGATHHGAFDLSYMRCIPHMRIIAPSDAQELRGAIRYAYDSDGPIAIRYSRGQCPCTICEERPEFSENAYCAKEGSDLAIVAVGRMVSRALEAANILQEQGISAAVYDMRFVKPVDAQAVRCASETGFIASVEENSVVGGFGSAVLESLSAQGIACKTLTLGLPDDFVLHGTSDELLSECGLDAQGIAKSISASYQK